MYPAQAAVLDLSEFVRLRAEHPQTRILDVRTPGEFDTERLPGAHNVPLDALPVHGPDICANVRDPIVLMCRSGQRARKAAEILSALGMQNLYVLDGGITSMVANGHPVLRGTPRLSLERQVRIAAGALAATGGFLALLVNPLFAALPALVGSGLVFAGISDTCAMGLMLAKLPYNRGASCDVPANIRALAAQGIAA